MARQRVGANIVRGPLYMPVIFADEIISTLDVRYPGHFCVKIDHLSAANILVPYFFFKEHIFARGNSPSEIAKAINTDAATINKNFMHFTNFEQKIQHCYHNQFFVPKDM